MNIKSKKAEMLENGVQFAMQYTEQIGLKLQTAFIYNINKIQLTLRANQISFEFVSFFLVWPNCGTKHMNFQNKEHKFK